MNKHHFLLCLVLATAISAQDYVLKGQLWGELSAGDDPAPELARQAGTVGYIPALSATTFLAEDNLIDAEWAYRMGAVSPGGVTDELTTSGRNHRLWLRYSSPRFEARLGLQKIAFGPGFFLRPLAWFDTLDPKDPTGQTDGVTALRLRLFPRNNLALWAWTVRGQAWDSPYSPGGRLEIGLGSVDFGATYHRQSAPETRPAVSLLPLTTPANRIGLDLRYDGFAGLWLEAVDVRSTTRTKDATDGQTIVMLGGDYTFPVGNGLYLVVEHLQARVHHAPEGEPSSSKVTAAVLSHPLGIWDQIMVILNYDWAGGQLYQYLRWQRTYDLFSFNLMASLNPRRSDYQIDPEYLPATLTGFGSGIQIMLIFNH